MGKITGHWKKMFNYEYLGAYSLQDNEIKSVVLTIDSVEFKEVVSTGNRKENCPVCFFKEKADWVKPMILNRTNSKNAAKVAKSDNVEDWSGVRIEVYIQSGVRAFGEVVDALRIKPVAPAPIRKPSLEVGTEAFNKAKTYVSEGNPIEAIEKKYSLGKEVKEALCKK